LRTNTPADILPSGRSLLVLIGRDEAEDCFLARRGGEIA
jgi:hypothetical protein